MQKRLSIACTLVVLGEAYWLDFKIDIDGKEKTKTIESKQWSQIEVMDQDHYALVPNNNSFALQNRPRVDEETYFLILNEKLLFVLPRKTNTSCKKCYFRVAVKIKS